MVAALLPAIAFAGALVPLRWPLELRQIASVTDGQPCRPGSVAFQPGSGICFYLTNTGMTVTAIQSAHIQERTLRIPKVGSAVVFWVIVRFRPAGQRQYLTLTSDIYRLPKPRNELTVSVRGHLLEFSIVHKPDTDGMMAIVAGSRTSAEHLLANL
jgi:hypothetical protein